MKAITMTLSSPDVKLVNGRASLTASVSNGTPEPQRVVLGAFPVSSGTQPASTSTWTTVEQPLRTIAPDATEQYVANFDTTAAPPGTYLVKLIAYSADEAPEEYSDQGSTVQLVVTPPPPPPPGKFPWWIVITGAVLVLVLIGVVFLLTRNTAPKLTSVAVRPADTTLQVGTSQQFTAVGTFGDGTTKDLTGADWRSADTSKAEVDSTGKVTARGPGTVLITAAQEGLEGHGQVSIPTAVLTRITVDPVALTLQPGQSRLLTAAGEFSDGTSGKLTSVAWRSENPAVVDVDSAGRVTARSAGDVLITASQAGLEGSTRISVSPPPEPALTKVTVMPGALTMNLGTTHQLKAQGTFSDGSTRELTASWRSATPATASVDQSGKVTARGGGIVLITASQNGIEGTARVTVLEPEPYPPICNKKPTLPQCQIP